jgi:CheY-like chemotaxis protein
MVRRRDQSYIEGVATILIIDDDVDGSQAIALYMERAGHHAILAANGRRALAAIAVSKPDAVILDMQMPQLDGVGFLKVLRGYFRTLGVPVAVLTGMPDGPKLDRIMEIGVRRVFRKADFKLKDLLEWVNEAAPLPASGKLPEPNEAACHTD